MTRSLAVVAGSGFGGPNAVKALAGTPLTVLILERDNDHLSEPLVYQVATGGIESGVIGFRNRIVGLVDWATGYFSSEPAARLTKRR